jgi:GNAT superfamily N-acetyltransferase
VSEGTHDTETFTVASCGPGDRAEQAGLFNACFKKPLDDVALSWRYDEGPHGGSTSFVTRNGAGLAVSGYACSPRRMLHRGDEATLAQVGETGDVMTHPDWRKRGLFSDLDRAAMAETKERGWPMVFGLPNRRSAHIFLKLGWEQIGSVRPWTFVLRSDGAARETRMREGRLKALLTPLGARAGRKARAAMAQAAAGLEVRALSSFPDEVAEVSRGVEACFGVMVRRDAAYLDWRFTRSPSGLHRCLGMFDSRGELASYVVVQRPKEGAANGYLVDVLARDDGALKAAIGAGLDELERSGASVVEATAMDGTWWRERLEENGFLPPKEENHLIVILYAHDPDHPLVAAAREPKRWYFTDGDRDDETMG